mgnify:CR=1 FL=1
MVITNGFTYIAFLMCLAGVLLALEKYTKWKIFNLVPPLVWIYVLNMIFCTMGLYHSKEVSAAYKAFEEQPAVCHDLCDAAALRLPETGQTGRPDGGHFPGLLCDPVHWLRDRLSHFQGFPGP